ncbi:hypothetical protein Taro_049227, partial [Colocasia esculenta]|nr:hypothetical protein [Colocasia esculenta]
MEVRQERLGPTVGLYTVFLFLCEEKVSGVLVVFVRLWECTQCSHYVKGRT